MLTIYITFLFVNIIDSNVNALIPAPLREMIEIKEAPFIGSLPGLGLVAGLIVITLIGAIAAGFLADGLSVLVRGF